MTLNPFVERYQDQIAGVLNCFDRVVITGTLPEICHAEAMGVFLSARGIRLFDYLILLARDLRYIDKANYETLTDQVQEVRRMLYAFMKKMAPGR